MRTRFQQGLDELRQKLLRMGGLAEQAVDRACQAYLDRDLTRCQLVPVGETQIDISERGSTSWRSICSPCAAWLWISASF
jgi:phosphate transport system protein